MRARRTRLQEVLLGLALLAGLVWNFARASEINDLRLEAGPTGTRAELALAARYVLASSNPKTRFGLPEVQLGLLPGLGGTVRLPEEVAEDLTALTEARGALRRRHGATGGIAG